MTENALRVQFRLFSEAEIKIHRIKARTGEKGEGVIKDERESLRKREREMDEGGVLEYIDNMYYKRVEAC